MTALPISDPAPIVDIGALNEGLAEVIPLFAAAAPETVGILPAAAIVLGGVQLDNYLLSQPWWNNFWIGVGGHLTDAWSAAGHFLFGHPSSAPSLDTVGQLIQLSLHVSMRFTRQLEAHALSLTSTMAARLYKGVISVANSLNSFETWTRATIGNVNAQLSGRINALDSKIDSSAANLANVVPHIVQPLLAAEVHTLMLHVINPIISELHASEARVQRTLDRLTSLEHFAQAHLAPELAATTGIAIAARTLAQHAADFTDECGEGMCETIGPKTNWGKLFKQFDSAALLALLTAVTALDPDDVEKAAVGFADTFGPVLSRWTEGWLGLTSDSVGDIPKEVAHDVGGILGSIIP